MPAALRSAGSRVRVAAAVVCATMIFTPVAPQMASAAAGDPTPLWGWGENFSGQTGDGHSFYALEPVLALTGVVAASGGDGHSLAVDGDGVAWSWGAGDSGRLGDETTVERRAPGAIPGLPFAVDVAAGGDHSLVLASNGRVFGFGDNGDGQTGNGTSGPDVLLPAEVGPSTLPQFKAIAAGSDHSVALDVDGGVWSWGRASRGQLGDGQPLLSLAVDQTNPVPLAGSGLPVFTDIAVGPTGSHTVALDATGVVWTWGENSSGELGDGTTVARSTAAPVVWPEPDTTIMGIAAGKGFTLALDDAGVVWVWGSNFYGVLGEGATVPGRPQPLAAPTGVVSIGAGARHAIVITDTGDVWTWGGNQSGQLGDGSLTGRTAPTLVAGLPAGGVVEATGGHAQTLAWTASGDLYGWGRGDAAGDGGHPVRTAPVSSNDLPAGVVDMAAGYGHVVTLNEDGTVRTWGYNVFGQLGDGTTFDKNAPVAVSGISSAIGIAAGRRHSLAALADGSVLAWGDDGNAQLGSGTSGSNQLSPVPVAGLPTSVVAVAAGELHSLALLADGSVWAWGANYLGQLGIGPGVSFSAPAAVPGLTDIVQISAHGSTSLAVARNGELWGWGQSGGTLESPADMVGPYRYSPILVAGLPPIVEASIGQDHVVAREADGTVWSWGANINGEMGEAANYDYYPPQELTTPSGATSVRAGANHTVALLDDGTVWAWGRNHQGQVGNGSQVDADTRAPVAGIVGVTVIAAGDNFSLAAAGAPSTDIVPPGGTVSTDPLGVGPTPADPLQASVTSPTGGLVAISAPDVVTPTPGYALLGQQVSIQAPAASVEQPLVIVFEIDASLVPPDENATTLVLLRNGSPVYDCDANNSGAAPDPCIDVREALPGGGIRLTALTSEASLWTVAVALNSAPTLNLGADVQLVAGGTLTRPGTVIDSDADDAWTVTVDYGDGSAVQTISSGPTKAFVLSHSYPDAGDFTVTVSAMDAAGDTAADQLTVQVQSRKAAVLSGFDQLVTDLGVRSSVAAPLRTSLTAAANQAEAGRTKQAQLSILVYRGQVAAALLTRKITRAQAQALNAYASTAKGTLGI